MGNRATLRPPWPTYAGLAAILASFIILGLIYASVTPLFESPDESSHLQVIHYLAKEQRLYAPVLFENRISSGAAMAESLRYHEPPFYYTPPLYHVLGALLTSWWTPMDDLPTRLIPNPSWDAGWSPQRNSDPWNKNVFVHLPGETWRGSPTMRAAWVLRLFSLVTGCVTIVCTCYIARLICPDMPVFALGATALVAFNPQFIANSTGVTNDPLLNAIFSLVVLYALRGMQCAPSWRYWGALGAVVGVGLLIKQSAFLLLPVGGLAILGQGPPGKLPPWRKLMADGLVFGLTALLVGGGWYALNAIQYNDPLGIRSHFTSQMPLTRIGFRELRAIFETYWAGFGWALLSVPAWVYNVIGIFTLVSASGIALTLLSKGKFHRVAPHARRSLGLLTALVGLNGASLLRWAIATGAPYGRLLFPSIPAIAVLLAWGLARWAKSRFMRPGLAAASMLLILFAIMVPWTTLAPAFNASRVLHALPQDAQPLDAMFENSTTLLGYQTAVHGPVWGRQEAELQTGDKMQVTLYWQASAATQPHISTWVQLGPQNPTQRIAEDNAWLGGTLYPSDFWQSGDIVQQTHHLRLSGQALPFGLYWLRLGLVDEAQMRIRLTDNRGDTLTLGPWRIRPNKAPSPTYPVNYRLSDGILLQGYDVALHDTLDVTLTWQAQSALPADYTVFVHWVDEAGTIITQHDGPPSGGRYPTSWWLPGDEIPDRHTLTPTLSISNVANLRVGMYDPATAIRLPAYDADHQRLPDDAIPLQTPSNKDK